MAAGARKNNRRRQKITDSGKKITGDLPVKERGSIRKAKKGNTTEILISRISLPPLEIFLDVALYARISRFSRCFLHKLLLRKSSADWQSVQIDAVIFVCPAAA